MSRIQTLTDPTLSRADATGLLAGRGPFENAPLTDFAQANQRDAFQSALDQVASELGRSYPMLIGGREVRTDATFDSVNPARPSQTIGSFPMADVEHVDGALAAAVDAFEVWSRTPATERAAVLFRAADTMRERRHWFSAWMVWEVGKSWIEADADTAEAIDFLEYYGRQMLELDRGADLHQIPSERSEMVYLPLGVGAVIPPWNFPNAILAGMTSAALVTGNTVVLKPAEQSPAIGWHVADLLIDSGLPDGVLNVLFGDGAKVGDALVDDGRTHFIAFTGSKAVGVRIQRRAASIQPGQKWLKRAILEMGGKDAVVVDETANLDEAAAGIVASAFGFQGQKCSAGSRAIIVDAVYDELLDKVVERTRDAVAMGDPTDPDTYLGPVIDTESEKKIISYLGLGREEGRIMTGGGKADREGHYIEPTVIADVDPHARIAQEEIFGPVLAVIRARDFDHALEIANDTDYGLTGALYSQNRDRIERAKREFHVGNLYFNRKCTGALVGVHPFGGFKMSGTDSKAGGPDYLLLFTQPKAISEKL